MAQTVYIRDLSFLHQGPALTFVRQEHPTREQSLNIWKFRNTLLTSDRRLVVLRKWLSMVKGEGLTVLS